MPRSKRPAGRLAVEPPLTRPTNKMNFDEKQTTNKPMNKVKVTFFDDRTVAITINGEEKSLPWDSVEHIQAVGVRVLHGGRTFFAEAADLSVGSIYPVEVTE